MFLSLLAQKFWIIVEPTPSVQILLSNFSFDLIIISQSSYFNRDDQALHGFAAHFKTESGEERAHGMKLMEYQTKRGGRVVFQDIAKPTTMEWGTPLEAMEAALELEKTVNQSLLD